MAINSYVSHKDNKQTNSQITRLADKTTRTLFNL